MIKLEITGQSFTEINAQLMDVVRGIGGVPSVKNDEPTTRTATETLSLRTEQFINNTISEMIAPAPQPAAAETTKRKRRSKDEIEADNAAKLASAQAEVKAAQASVAPIAAPITIPSIPTTSHLVSLPRETAAPVQQSFEVPKQAPVQHPANAYDLQTFKQNLIMIINDLLTSGKLTSQWIADTSAAAFGGAELWMWAQNEPKIKELFDNFVEWQFIQKFEVL